MTLETKGTTMNSLPRVSALVGLSLALGACTTSSTPDPVSDDVLATEVAASLIAACPVAETNDEDARAACAANLTNDKYLASVMQEQTGTRSIITVHAEHAPRSQTILVPVRPSSLLSASASVVLGSINTSRAAPFTLSETRRGPGPTTSVLGAASPGFA